MFSKDPDYQRFHIIAKSVTGLKETVQEKATAVIDVLIEAVAKQHQTREQELSSFGTSVRSACQNVDQQCLTKIKEYSRDKKHVSWWWRVEFLSSHLSFILHLMTQDIAADSCILGVDGAGRCCDRWLSQPTWMKRCKRLRTYATLHSICTNI